MRSILAQEFMVKRLITLRPEMDVMDAVKLLLKYRISGAPVVDSRGKFLGVFSEKCCMHIILDAAYDSLPTNHVEAFMDRDAQTCRPDTDLLSIAQVFLLTSRRRLPVVDEHGMLLGQVSRRDVLRVSMQELERPLQHQSSVLYLSALADSDSSHIA